MSDRELFSMARFLASLAPTEIPDVRPCLRTYEYTTA